MKVHIVLSSVTFATRSKHLLEQSNISCYISQTPKQITNKGCAYSVIIDKENIKTSLEIIKSQDFNLLGVYEKRGDDMYVPLP